MSSLPNLLSTYTLSNGITLKNRVALAPMTRGRSSSTGVPDPELMSTYYTQRASLGLIITEGTQVSEQASGWVNAPGIWTDEQTEAWKPIVDAIHAAGSVVYIQLWHLGRAAHSSFYGLQPVAPTAIAIKSETHINSGEKVPYEVPRELTTEEIPAIVEEFRRAAENAKRAGFDGVEVHGANGYLLDEFTQSATNHRTDEYGGSFENRIRFPIQVLEAVLTVFPPEQVGYRISPNGVFNDMGSDDFRETFVAFSEKLAQYNLSYLHVMDGLGFGFHQKGEPLLLSEIRAVYPGTIIANCGYDKETAEQRVKDGDADIVAFGRPALSNPDLVRRFAEDLPLNEPDYAKLYTPGPEGYIDYPFYSEN